MRVLVRRTDGSVEGPFEGEAVQAMAIAGQIGANDQLRDFDTGMPVRLQVLMPAQPQPMPQPLSPPQYQQAMPSATKWQTKRANPLTSDDGTGEMWGAVIFAILGSALAVIFTLSRSSIFPVFSSFLLVAGVFAYRCHDKDPDKGRVAIGFSLGCLVVFLLCAFVGQRLTRFEQRPFSQGNTSGGPGAASSPSTTVAASSVSPSGSRPNSSGGMPVVSAPNPNAFDWASFADTGGGDYISLQPAQFDPNDPRAISSTTVTKKYPADSPTRPEKNDDGTDPQIETDDQGQQWAIYTSHLPANASVEIEQIHLNPTMIGGRPYVFGSVVVANLSPYNITGLQLVYESGDLKTTILTSDKVVGMIGSGILPHTGLGLQVKSYAPNSAKTIPTLRVEAQIDGPPGLFTSEAELEEVEINSAGQVVGSG